MIKLLKPTIIMVAAAFIASGCSTKDTSEKKADGDSHDAHSGEITFTTAQAKSAGLATETVSPRPFRSVITAAGQIQSSQGNEQTIAATASGIVRFNNALINEGSPVRAGETVVAISAKKLEGGDPTAQAKAAFDAAEKEFKRAERLVADQIISTKEFEQARLRYESAKAVYAGQAGSVTAQGVTVASPMSGYIKSRLVGQGDYVSVGQPIAVVSQNKRLQLRADVPEGCFNQLRSVQSANFKTTHDDAVHSLASLNGRLVSYGKSAAAGTAFIPVTFEFDNIGDIVPGAYVEVYLLSAERAGVISVPVSAITEEQGLTFVYVQTSSEHYRKQEVTLGQTDGVRVEIVSGLTAGDKVVTRGAYQVKLASMTTAIPGHSH